MTALESLESSQEGINWRSPRNTTVGNLTSGPIEQRLAAAQAANANSPLTHSVDQTNAEMGDRQRTIEAQRQAETAKRLDDFGTFLGYHRGFMHEVLDATSGNGGPFSPQTAEAQPVAPDPLAGRLGNASSAAAPQGPHAGAIETSATVSAPVSASPTPAGPGPSGA